ncbi:MAG: hypothetical protein R2734_01475 [Nocardioides sp.]
MQGWGELVGRHRLRVLVASLAVVAAAAAYGAGVFGSLSNGGYFVADSDSSRAATTIRQTFPQQPVDLVVIYASDDRQVTDPTFRAAVTSALARVRRREPDIRARTWYDTGAPALVSGDRHATEVAHLPRHR